MVQLQESFPFGDGSELFNTALKYSWAENTWSNKVFETNNLSVMHKALLRYMKILSHKNLEP